MAERYSKTYSPPDTDNSAEIEPNQWHNQRRSRVGGRTNILFLAPLPLGIGAFGQDAAGLATTLFALGLLLLAAWLTREGVLAQEAYEARKIARRPALPRKMLGSIFTGLGLFAAVFAAQNGVLNAMIYAGLGTILHGFSFGLDPMKNKGMAGIDQFQQDRVAKAVVNGEKYLTAMSDAILRAGDPKVEARLERFQSTVRDLFRTVEEDPRDLTSARKYLSVYLQGAKDATVKFADIFSKSRDATARAKYIALLDDLETGFANKTEAFLVNEKGDLNVEIEVLRERLQRDGIQMSEN